MIARVTRLLLLLLLILFLRSLVPWLAPIAGSADASGYLWSARLFRTGALSRPIDHGTLPLDGLGADAFAPLGTRVRPGGTALVPTYPPGLPLHVAAAWLVVRDERAIRWVMVLAAGAALWLTYRLGRVAGLARAWAAAAAGLCAASPLFLFLAVQPMSDVLATAWASATVFFAWRARCHARYALAAGASLGLSALVRPTNLLLVLPLLVALPRRGRPLALAALGALPAALFLAGYQSAAYGHPLVSGYGDVRSAFSSSFLAASLAHYLRWLPVLFSPLVFVAPLAAGAWRGPLRAWRHVALAWGLAVFGTYAGYVHTAETWWYLRFVLPGMPPLLVAAAAGLQWLWRAGPGVMWPARPALARLVASVAAVLLVGAAVARQVTHPLGDAYRQVRADERIYPEAIRWLELEGSGRAPVLMIQLSGAANYYAPGLRLIRYDRLTPERWAALRAWQRRTGSPVRAALAPFERDELLGRDGPRLPCDWQPRGSFRWVSLWNCPPPR